MSMIKQPPLFKVAIEEAEEEPYIPSFFRLPTEIRRMIYNYVLLPPNTGTSPPPEEALGQLITMKLRPRQTEALACCWVIDQVSPFLQTNRQVYFEARGIFYSSLNFRFPKNFDLDYARRFLDPLSEGARASIRCISVQVVFDMVPTYSGWWKRKAVWSDFKEGSEELMNGLGGLRVVKFRVNFWHGLRTDTYKIEEAVELVMDLARTFLRVEKFIFDGIHHTTLLGTLTNDCQRRLAEERRMIRL